MGDGRMADIMFDGTSTDLNDAGRNNLGPIADRLMANPRSRVTIMTHADRNGAAMARTRAAAVRQAMIDRGVPANRIRVVASRPTRGMDPNGVHVMVR
jgi:outer membrane protein OmpA-like peptidoglycan-associated protein